MSLPEEIQALLAKSATMPEQRTPPWYEMRNSMITASDVGTVLGTNKYSTRLQVLRNKVDVVLGQGYGEVFTGNAATLWGQEHEDEVRDRFSQLYGVECFDCALLPHPEHPWVGASPDGLVSDRSLIEIKCPLRRVPKPDYIPPAYYDQMQLQLEVCNLEKCYFVEWKPGARLFDEDIFQVQVVKRDRSWWTEALPKLRIFWDEVRYYIKNPDKAKEALTKNKRADPIDPPSLKRKSDEITADMFFF
jgi:putative phage-type endonuclease